MKLRYEIKDSAHPTWKGRTMSTKSEVLEFAKESGLHVDTWSPGDGATRYRFFLVESDYFAGSAVGWALGAKSALLFVQGYRAGISAR